MVPIIAAFVAFKIFYAEGVTDACTLKEANYVDTFRGAQFVRTHADPEASTLLKKLELEDSREAAGGDYGCTPEPTEHDDFFMARETHRVTRCSTTVCALTRFMCGPGMEVPRAQHVGARSLWGTLSSAWNASVKAGAMHSRIFYRVSLSVYSRKALESLERDEDEEEEGSDGERDTGYTGLSHVWLVAALSDGSFYWLQSFIGQYSLYTWMGRKAHYHLTADQLHHRLTLLDRLTLTDAWDTDAEAMYKELFNVSMKEHWFNDKLDPFRRGRKLKTAEFNAQEHALLVVWDKVCDVDVACKLRTAKAAEARKSSPPVRSGARLPKRTPRRRAP